MTLDLARRLLASGAVAARDVEAALYLSVVRGVSLARALVDRGVLSERALEEELSRRGGMPLRQVNPAPELASRLPRGMSRMLAAVPLRADTGTGVVEVAAVDPHDPHVAAEFAFHLGVPVRLARATMSAVEEAIRRVELGDGSGLNRPRRRTPAFPHGAPDSIAPPPPGAPPIEEVPIPLVRRVSGPLLGDPIENEDDVVWPSEDTFMDSEPERPSASRRAAALLRESGRSGPSVSFPSAPPPAIDSEPPRISAPEAMSPLPPTPTSRRRPASLDEIGGDDVEPLTDRTSAPYEESEAVEAEPPQAAPEEVPVVVPASNGPGNPSDLADPPRSPASSPRSSPGPMMFGPWAGASPLPTLPEALDALQQARSRDQVIDLALSGLCAVAERAAIFVVRKDGYQGWACNPAFGAEDELRRVVIPHEMPSVFATAGAAGYYLGPIPHTPGHTVLLSMMRGASPDVAVYLARARGRPAMVLVADQLDDTLLGTRAMGDLATRAGEALGRIVAGRL